MRRMTAVVGLFVALVPRLLAAQASGDQQGRRASDDDPPRRMSVHVAAGPTFSAGNESGATLQAVSIGYAPTPKLSVLVSGWHVHTPPRTRRFSDGGSSTTRGGTLWFASGEVRFTLRSDDRVTPYALAGAGLGVSRPTVNDTFPTPVTNAAYLVFSGAGLMVPLGSRLRASADFGFLLFGERDVILPMMPLRVGLAWRF